MSSIKFIIVILLFSVCSTYEQLGTRKYKTKIERINIGEFDALIEYFKFYHGKKNQEYLLDM